jgi:hypothetical protein
MASASRSTARLTFRPSLLPPACNSSSGTVPPGTTPACLTGPTAGPLAPSTWLLAQSPTACCDTKGAGAVLTEGAMVPEGRDAAAAAWARPDAPPPLVTRYAPCPRLGTPPRPLSVAARDWTPAAPSKPPPLALAGRGPVVLEAGRVLHLDGTGAAAAPSPPLLSSSSLISSRSRCALALSPRALAMAAGTPLWRPASNPPPSAAPPPLTPPASPSSPLPTLLASLPMRMCCCARGGRLPSIGCRLRGGATRLAGRRPQVGCSGSTPAAAAPEP